MGAGGRTKTMCDTQTHNHDVKTITSVTDMGCIKSSIFPPQEYLLQAGNIAKTMVTFIMEVDV